MSEFPTTVSADLLCAKEIEFPEELGDSVRFTISIDEETEGDVTITLFKIGIHSVLSLIEIILFCSCH